MTSLTIKLQKYLAEAHVASRRKAEELIASGRVSVNDRVASIGQRVDPDQDRVTLDGQVVQPSTQHTYLIFHKPAGVISTRADEQHRPTVLSLIPAKYHHLYPVGRLDADSEGLILLTDDGALTQHLTHPKFEVPKTYEVSSDRPLSELARAHLEKGVKIDERYIVPDRVEDLTDTTLAITLHEGRKHLVRRMFERLGYNVTRLVRTQLGPLQLADLPSGQFRLVTPEEKTQLLAVLDT